MKNLRIMLVDDSAEILDAMYHALVHILGVEIVGQARNETEAIGLFRAKKPDLVCLDIRLQQGSGISILKKIKEISAGTIVFMITNYPFNGYRRRCLELGAEFFFDKTRDIPLVVQMIEELAVIRPNRLIQPV